LTEARGFNKVVPVLEHVFKCGYYLWQDKGKGHDLDTDDYSIVKQDFLSANGLLNVLKNYPIEKLKLDAVKRT